MEIRFLGPLGIVTGSCTWMRDINRNWSFLVDCGIQQGEPTESAWNEADWPFDPKEIQFVVLTHAHMDHSGLIPTLYRKGFTGPVYCTKETQLLATELLKDAIRHSKLPYSAEDIELIRWKEPGADKAFGSHLPVDTDLFLQFLRTGHIVGAVSVVVSWGSPGPEQRSIHFSGDIGPGQENHETLPLTRFPMHTSIPSNYAVVESTYGAVVRNPHQHSEDQRRSSLRQLLDETLESNGTLVIPAFSIARTQDLMFDLHWLVAEADGQYDKLTFLLDSPLASKVNPVFADAFTRTERTYKGKVRPRWLGKQFYCSLDLDDKNPYDIIAGQNIIRMTLNGMEHFASESSPRGNHIAWNWRPIFSSATEAKRLRKGTLDGPTVIVTSSGTCEGGPVVQWLSRLLKTESTTVAMTGYCAANTVGGQLFAIAHVPLSERPRDAGFITLANQTSIKTADIRAKICKINGYSAHADQNDLLNWLVWERDGNFNLAGHEVFVQHGEDRQRQSLAEALTKRAHSKDLTVQTYLPEDPLRWWSLEEKSNVIDLEAERARIETEIQILQSQLLNIRRKAN